MNRRNLNITAIVIAVLLLAAAGAYGTGTMGVSRGHDLDVLWAQAQKQFDTSAHDAILLLESRHETILESGGRRTLIHRVVWIGASPAIREHADLRIPWNSDRSTMRVLALRTWRGGRWWPHESEVSETAVVETLPGAVATADDYTTMRETMLLHDGVELPCIMETAYEIEEQLGAAGYDGIFVMQQRDPAALVELRLQAPEGIDLKIKGGNNAPAPKEAGGEDGSTHIIKMENLERLGSPGIEDPAAYAPFVAWSTWESWAALKDALVPGFDGAANMDPGLTEILSERLEHEPSDAARARKVAGLVDELTRSIHYDSRFWSFSPRQAPRTFETAYGHCLDRAVLAAAMFRGAGLEAEPVLISYGPASAGIDIPGLSRFGEMRICVHAGPFRAIYDPADGMMSEGPRAIYGRAAWKPASDDSPWRYPEDRGEVSSCTLNLTLEPGDDGTWKGTGYIDAGGVFCPYADMTGLGEEAKAHLVKIAGSVLPGAEVSGYNPEVFEKTHVAAGFAFTLKEGDLDDHGRRSINIGDPTGGITSIIPSDVHLYHEDRTSPVVLPGKMEQRIRLRIKAEGKTILHLPEAVTIENAAGRFMIGIEKDGDWITIDRTLSIDSVLTGPGDWPHLRALLLENADAAGRTVLMK